MDNVIVNKITKNLNPDSKVTVSVVSYANKTRTTTALRYSQPACMIFPFYLILLISPTPSENEDQ